MFYSNETPQELENGAIIYEGQRETISKFYNLISSWIKDEYGLPITRYEGFDLYKMIARIVKDSVPIEQINKPCFSEFGILKKDLNADEPVYEAV
jgi:hypothetical protein